MVIVAAVPDLSYAAENVWGLHVSELVQSALIVREQGVDRSINRKKAAFGPIGCVVTIGWSIDPVGVGAERSEGEDDAEQNALGRRKHRTQMEHVPIPCE